MDGMNPRDSSIGAALRIAGYIHPRERLLALANKVLDKHGGSYQVGAQALLTLASKDAELLWELMGNARERLAIDFLNGVYIQRKRSEAVGREPERAGGSVQGSAASDAGHDGNDRPARSVTTPKPAAGPVRAAAPASAPRAAGAPRDASLRMPKSNLDAWKPGVAAAAEEDRRKSKLYTFRINGQPIAEVTAGEARKWATAQAHQASFVSLMIEGVPDDMLIGKARTPEEADALYARAGVAARGN